MKSEVIYRENEGALLFLSLPWPVDCFPLFSLELEELEEGEGRETVTHSRLVPGVTGSGGDREVHLMVSLQGSDNTLYTAQISSISSERDVPAPDKLQYSECQSDYPPKSFRELTSGTHDVQLVEISFTPTSIIANCQFAVGSPALGCSVHIVSQDDDTSVMMLSVMRESGANEEGLSLSAEGKAEDLESGVYTVRVYDIESNGETSSSGTPAHTETVEITQPTT